MPSGREHVAELRREVGFYLSFMDEEVFWGVDLPKERRSKPSAPTVDTSGATATTEVPSIPKVAPKYARWDTIVHLSRPVVAAGETCQTTTELWPKRRALQPTQTTSIGPPSKSPKALLPPKSPPPARTLALVRPPTPPHGFSRGSCMLENPGTCRGRWRDTCRHHVHQNGIKPWPFQC